MNVDLGFLKEMMIDGTDCLIKLAVGFQQNPIGALVLCALVAIVVIGGGRIGRRAAPAQPLVQGVG
jgi:hypothetical protein